jgi:hypothetical protein
MRNIASICRRLMILTMFIGFSVVVCSGVTKHSLIETACINNHQKCCSNANKDGENLQPNQLVSIRIMQLI